MGTQRQMEILDRVAAGNVFEGDFVRLQDVGWTMTEASLCGLGQTAASALLSAMKLWPELFSKSESKKLEVIDESNEQKPKSPRVKKVVKEPAQTKPAKKLAVKKTETAKSVKKVTQTKIKRSSK